jgi:hypothetical protein
LRGTGQAPSNPLSESPVLEESFALLHPEAEWDSLLREEPFRGREEIQKGVEDWLDSIDNWRVSVEQAVDAGSDRVLVLLRVSIHGKAAMCPPASGCSSS